MTIDGRQTGISEGMTLPEMTNLMINTYGITNATNLDGRGSTTMVMNFYDDGLPAQVHQCSFRRFRACRGNKLGGFCAALRSRARHTIANEHRHHHELHLRALSRRAA
jgi:hypothetical protein